MKKVFKGKRRIMENSNIFHHAKNILIFKKINPLNKETQKILQDIIITLL
jgi:hypothetical protein